MSFPTPPSTSLQRSVPSSPKRTSTPSARLKQDSSDPFLSADISTSPTNTPLPSTYATSQFTALISAPLTALSFIFSLTLIDYRQRLWRVSQHPSPASSGPWYARLAALLSTLLDPEPYQDPQSATWHRRASASAGRGEPRMRSPPGDVPHPRPEAWYARKKHRAVARMELAQALEMKGAVAAVLVLLLAMGLAACAAGMRWVWGWWMGWAR